MHVSFFLLYWIIAIISGATAIGFTIAALTREREVAELIINGSSYRKVGEKLNISLSTVQSRIVRLYQKTGVNSKVGLIRMYI